MRPFSLAFLVGILLALPSQAGWQPVGPDYPSQYTWLQSQEDPDAFALLLNGRQAGAFYASQSVYYALLPNGAWQVAECPVEAPAGTYPDKCLCCRICRKSDCRCSPSNKCWPGCHCGEKKQVESDLPTGVDVNKVESDKHSVNGRSCSKEDVLEALQKAQVPSDQNKLRLVLIGEQNATDAILGDLKGIPEAADFQVTAYTPDHWAVKDTGLSAGKPFSIVVLTPDGTVLHRQWDYDGGVQALADALRDAKQGYDPSKDADLRKRDPIADAVKVVVEKVKSVPNEVWIILAVVGAFLLYQKKVKK